MYIYTYICIYICMCVYVFIVISVCMYQHMRLEDLVHLNPVNYICIHLQFILFISSWFLFFSFQILKEIKNKILRCQEKKEDMSRRNSRVYPSSDDLIPPRSSSSKVRPSPPQDDPTTVPSRGEQQSSFHQNLAGDTMSKKGALEEVASCCQYIAAISSWQKW